MWAGVDYEAILREAEDEANVILWDGGNNDTSFFRPDLLIVVVDPHRVGHELSYYPGEHNVRLADIVLVNKVDTADLAAVEQVEANVRAVNSDAHIVRAACPPTPVDPSVLEGRRVLALEDGPTTTHGGMRYGAASIAAQRLGATLVDPRPFSAGELRETFERYPDVGPLLPAMGYGRQQVEDLQETLRRAPAAGVEAVPIAVTVPLRAHPAETSQPSRKSAYPLRRCLSFSRIQRTATAPVARQMQTTVSASDSWYGSSGALGAKVCPRFLYSTT